MARITRRDAYSLTEGGRLRVYTRTVRCAAFLPLDQRLVLLFILDQTIGWRKVHAEIPIREFERGVFRRRGGRRVQFAAGLSFGEERIRQAIDQLVGLRAITAYSGTYAINDQWCAPEIVMWDLREDRDYIYHPDL